MIDRCLTILTFVFGMAAGGMFVNSALPTVARAQSPAPTQGGMMSSGGCAGMQSMMQSHMKSQADMAMMQSMKQMQRSMMSMHFTGNADHDFLVMMIPHHQSAIDAAEVELRDGKNPKVRALAQQIIKAQQAEIREMRGWLAEGY